MLRLEDILETRDMIDKRHLDIRTITMGISLLDCADPDITVCARKIYDKITRRAEKTGFCRRGHRAGIRHSYRQ